jgi:cytochrome b561
VICAPASAASSPRYTRTARALHWLVAAGVLGALAFALSFDDLPLSPRKIHLINYHKWCGLTVLFAMVLRLAWRLRHAPPALPAALAGWERRAAHATHVLIYLLLFVTPLLGWWLSSAKGFPLKYLGIVPLPDLAGKDRSLAEAIEPFHLLAAWSLLGLAGLHVGAALKHQFVDRTDFLRRMV